MGWDRSQLCQLTQRDPAGSLWKMTRPSPLRTSKQPHRWAPGWLHDEVLNLATVADWLGFWSRLRSGMWLFANKVKQVPRVSMKGFGASLQVKTPKDFGCCPVVPLKADICDLCAGLHEVQSCPKFQEVWTHSTLTAPSRKVAEAF